MNNNKNSQIRELSENNIKTNLNENLAQRISSVLRAERDILSKIVESVEGSGWKTFTRALNSLNNTQGRIIITGMGKSGHIGKKVAATMSSLGMPAHFIHPAEASHGDLGMIKPDDSLIAFSNSGNTSELKDILAYSLNLNIPIIGVTMGENSLLAKYSTTPIIIPKMPEGCNLGLAPTTSTTAQLAYGDALSVGISVMRDFDRDNFHKLHPGGSLGQSTTKIEDVMKTGIDLPLVRKNSKTRDIVWEMAKKSSNLVGIINENGFLVGVIRTSNLNPEKEQYAEEMLRTASPVVSPNESVATALSRMQTNAVDSIFVVENDKPIGLYKK